MVCWGLLSFQVQAQQTEWDELGTILAELLYENDKDLDYFFDERAFWKRVLVPKPKNPDIQRLNKDILKEVVNFSIWEALDLTAKTDAFKYLYSHPDSVLVFRQWDEDGNFNYLLFKIDYLGNRWKVVDMYSVLLGKYLSAQIKTTLYLPRILRLLGDENARQHIANSEIYMEANQLNNDGEVDRAYSKISGIPVEERLMDHQRFKINLAISLESDEKIARSIKEHKSRFPKDKSLPIVLLDYNLLHEQYDQAIKALEIIQETIGRDAYLDYQKSIYYQLNKDQTEALEAILHAIQKEPEVEDYHLQHFAICASKGPRKKALHVLDVLMEHYDYCPEQIEWWLYEYYPKFYRSGAFKRWLRQKNKTVDVTSCAR